jgi:formylglycine-generating enzyme
MHAFHYSWAPGQMLDLVFVEGTHGRPFPFGDADVGRPTEIPDFFITSTPITNALWTHVMSEARRRSARGGELSPVEYVSWDDIAGQGGFLERINAGPVLAEFRRQTSNDLAPRFRLLSETEWEYAARGGKYWPDGFSFSGSRTIDEVAWYDRNSGRHIHDVAQKAPNQLGVYDMSGNVWEWCQDSFTRDVSRIPADGRAFGGESEERVLRGGCYNNWSIHCTVSKRYEITHDCRDESIGFRLGLSRT